MAARAKLSIAPSSQIYRKGFSLAEIIVSLALISLIMLSIHSVLLSGTKYLNKTTLTTELQQACVLGSGRLVTELLESNASCIRGDTTNHRYVSFGSPRDQRGLCTFDTASGELNWHAYVGFYVEERPGQEPAMYRKEKQISPPDTSPPPIPAGYDEIFWGGLAQPAQRIANRVYYLDVVSSTNINVILGVKSRDGRFLINIVTKLKARN